MLQIPLIIVGLAVLTLLHAPAAAAAALTTADHGLKAWMAPAATRAVADNDGSVDGDVGLLPSVARFYHQIGYRPVWTDADGLLPQGEILMQVLATASASGLFAPLYRPPYGSVRYADVDRPSEAATVSLPRLPTHVRLDIMLTTTLINMVRHIAQGRIDPESIDGQPWETWRRPPMGDIAIDLARAVEEDRLQPFIASVHPRNRDYRALKQALARYERIRADGGWPVIPPGPTLRPGDNGARVDALRRRLMIGGDGRNDLLAASIGFDATVGEAVKRFQRRHGLATDGLVGAHTLAALNVPVAARITLLKLNMERRRWLPDDLGNPHVLVNIPGFALHMVVDGDAIDQLRAIVGREDRPTPVMSGDMAYLEFNPYWNIPHKIARQDILPKVVEDPEYLSRQGIRVYANWAHGAPALDPSAIAWERLANGQFPYRLRQDPSPANALGQIKFMFPNPRSIYIHDTPARGLFDRSQRDFSSGCVRVDAPLDLALRLLRSQGWDRGRLQAAVARGTPQTVLLDKSVPVHLVYFTAWVDEAGEVNFRQDIYGRDRRLLAALTRDDSDGRWCADGADGCRAMVNAEPRRYISTVDTPLLAPPGTAAGHSSAGL